MPVTAIRRMRHRWNCCRRSAPHVPNDQIIHATIIVDEPIPHACHLPPIEIGERQARLLQNSLGRLSDDFEAVDKGAFEHSSLRNASRVVVAACADRNSASRKMSRSSSLVEGGIADGRKDQTRLAFGDGLVRDEIHAPTKQFLQPFVQGKEIVVTALGVVELDIDVHVAVIACFAAAERAKHADPTRAERLEFGYMRFNDGQWIHIGLGMLPGAGAPFKPARNAHAGRITRARRLAGRLTPMISLAGAVPARLSNAY